MSDASRALAQSRHHYLVQNHLPSSDATLGMQHPNWPVFELVTVTAPSGMPLAIPSLRVPRRYFRYQADDYLSTFATPERPNLLQFGSHPATSSIFCLDVISGEVVNLRLDRNGQVRKLPHSLEFVNSSLAQFNRSIEVLIELFPYDDGRLDGGDVDEDDEYDWQAAADRLEKAVEAIDERVSVEWQGYWAEFFSDITLGDFATYLVLTDD